MAEKTYDCVIVGGGPAGLSAAIYLARFNRTVLVVDRGHGGRWQTHEVNENYLGFPQGIHTVKLRELGVEQAERFGAKFITDEIEYVHHHQNGEIFVVTGKKQLYQGRTIIFATGVSDHFPPFKHEPEYLGRSLFWCITCDGHKTINKRVLVLGNSDEAACDCLQFLIYTKDLVFLTNDEVGKAKISAKWKQRLKQNKVPIIEGYIKNVVGHKGMVQEVILNTGETIKTDFIFSEQGSSPHSTLAKELGIELNREGFVCVDLEQRTNVPKAYAAGDVTRYFSHQIATAVHEGSMAAQAANYDLYEDFQRMTS